MLLAVYAFSRECGCVPRCTGAASQSLPRGELKIEPTHWLTWLPKNRILCLQNVNIDEEQTMKMASSLAGKMLLNEYEEDMKSLKCITNVDLILNYASGFLLYKEKELTRDHSEKMAEEGRRSYCMMDIQNDREKSLRETFEKIRRLEITQQGGRVSEEGGEEEENENKDVDSVIKEIVDEMIVNLQYIKRKAERHHAVLAQKAAQVTTMFIIIYKL